MKFWQFSFLFGLLFLVTSNLDASAQLLTSYNGTGTNASTGDALSFAAEFTVLHPGTSISQLQIKLTNRITGTNTRGDLLSGVFFDLSGVTSRPANDSTGVTTALVGTPDSGQKSKLTHGADGTVPLDQTVNGSFAFGDFRALTSTQHNYGVNSTGYSNSGATPEYSFSGFGLGGGADDYTIRPNTANNINGNDILVINNEVLLTLSGFGSGLASTSQLSNVYFAVGSGAQSVGGVNKYITVRAAATPEPGTVGMLIGLAVSGAYCIRRRRRKKS